MLVRNKTLTHCLHCSKDLGASPLLLSENERFCCHGCLSVYQCLNNNGLSKYYEIASLEGIQPKKVEEDSDNLHFYTNKDFLKDYNLTLNEFHYRFYIQGISCGACAWIFNHCTHLDKDIIFSQFSIDKNILELKLKNSPSLFRIVSLFSSMGYKLIPLKKNDNLDDHYNRERNNELIRIGVTAAIWMNIMIFAVSVYAGAAGRYQNFFNVISSILFLPIFLYSALPFYRASIRQLKYFKPSLDLPISLSIIFGSLFSYYSVYFSAGHVYFDSIAMLVFLILSTRFFLKSLIQKEMGSNSLPQYLDQQQVIKIDQDQKIPLHLSQIKKNDQLFIGKNQFIPFDGTIIKGQSYVNESLITGESFPTIKNSNDQIYSGSINLSDNLIIVVNNDIEKQSFNEYLNAINIEPTNLKKYTDFGHKYSIALSLLLVIISSIFFSIYPLAIAYEKTLALLIVCCPCALGIGIPLACLLKLKQLALKGIIINDTSVFERFNSVKKLCFDKTGTLTNGDYQIKSIKGDQNSLDILLGLESISKHPIAKFLTEHFKTSKYIYFSDHLEIAGLGIQGSIGNDFYLATTNSDAEVILLKNDELLLSIALEEKFDQEKIEYLNKLSNRFKISILSGDKLKNVDAFSLKTNNKSISYFGNLSPNAKKDILINDRQSIYIGDGLNDVWAMKEAYISISLNCNKIVNKASDIIFWGGKIKKLDVLFDNIKELHETIKISIFISIIYNLIGFSLVISSQVSALSAAILMPLSSIFLIGFNYYRYKTGVLKWKP